MKRIWTWLLVFLFCTGARAAHVYLVSVGNNLGRPSDPGLKYAERDARELAAVLQRLGGVPAMNVTTLLGEDARTLSRVLLDMNVRIRAESSGASPDSVLIVYYSGHADAAGLHLGDSTLAFDDLKDMVAASAASVRLLIVDSCRSGGVTRVKGASAAEEFEIDLYNGISAEGMAIVTSSAAGEDSYESDDLRGSFFSHHLINALRGAADANQDGKVTLDEAYRYTYHQTLNSSGRTSRLQHPTYSYDLKGKGGLVLTSLSNDKNRSGRLFIQIPGFYFIMERDGSGPVAAEVSVGSRGVLLVLAPGEYFVQKRSATSYEEYDVALEPGKRLDLSKMDHRTVKYARLVRKGGEVAAAYRVYVLGGAKGEIIDGLGVTPSIGVGWAVDLTWLSLGVRFSYSRKQMKSSDGFSEISTREFGAYVTACHYWDFPFISFSIGLLAGVSEFGQGFVSTGDAPDLDGWGFGFGGLAGVEMELLPALVFMAEGGPLTQVYDKAIIEEGAVVGSKIHSPFTWWFESGFAWRF